MLQASNDSLASDLAATRDRLASADRHAESLQREIEKQSSASRTGQPTLFIDCMRMTPAACLHDHSLPLSMHLQSPRNHATAT